jgi:hypothetical protein
MQCGVRGKTLALSVVCLSARTANADEIVARDPRATSPPSRTEPQEDPTVHRHDGFFLREGLGLIPRDQRSDVLGESLIGGTPLRGLVIGLGLLSNSDVIGEFGFLQYYPYDKGGFHLQALGGTAGGRHTPLGPLLGGGLGYDFWLSNQTSLGLFARIAATPPPHTIYGSQHGSFLALSATFTWH